MKRIWCAALCAMTALCLMACGGQDDNPASGIEDPMAVAGNKIGIITGSETATPEAYIAAKAQQEKNPEEIVWVTYEEDATDDQAFATALDELLEAGDIGAIIIPKAIVGAGFDISAMRTYTGDILVIAGSPEEDYSSIAGAGAADVVIAADDVGSARAMVLQAKSQGAKTFVHISFDRQMENDSVQRTYDMIQQTCSEEGLQFVSVSVSDPETEGTEAMKAEILESVPKWVSQYGKDTAFYGTDCDMQAPLIQAVVDQGAILPQQCCPSPFHGIPQALGIEIPQDKMGDTDYAIKQIKQALREKNYDGRRLSTWPVSIQSAIVDGGVEYAKRYLDGQTNGKNDAEQIQECLNRALDSDQVIWDVYQTERMEDVTNYHVLSSEYIDFAE